MRERQRYRKERRDVLRVDKEQRLRETERDEERNRERERENEERSERVLHRRSEGV